MVANRGYDSNNSRSRQLLIEAASQLLENEGAHAISARRVAERAGLKPQLVHYYFRTMEDLLVAVFEDAVEKYLELHDRALASPRPLRAMWELNSNVPNVRRNMAFIALGAIHPKLREQMRAAGDSFREVQVAAIRRTMVQSNLDPEAYPPASIAMLMSAVARTLAMEGQIGVKAGHQELLDTVERFLDRIEPPERGPDRHVSLSASVL